MEIAKKIHAINITQTMDYQDLSAKLNFPTEKAGTFAVWFTGLIDNFGNELSDSTEWESLWDACESWANQRSCAGGLTHTYRFDGGGTLTSSVAYTGSYYKLYSKLFDDNLKEMPYLEGKNSQNNLIVSVQHKRKISSRYTMQNGVEYRHMSFKACDDYVHRIGDPEMYHVYDAEGNTMLARAFTNHKASRNSRTAGSATRQPAPARRWRATGKTKWSTTAASSTTAT